MNTNSPQYLSRLRRVVEASTVANYEREEDFMAAVIDLAHHFRWRVAHFRPALTARGWRTPVQADGKGFPDLLMVRGDRMVIAELKSNRGRVDTAQHDWIVALTAAIGLAGGEVYVWRPAHWDAIVKVLER